MSLNAMTNQRPTVPAGDTIIYLQTPKGNGELDVEEVDSWDMAEEKAKQATAADAPVDDADVESASTGSDSGTSSTGSTSSSSGASSSSSTSSSSGAGSTGSATSATALTTASAAASATSKMTAAVPAAAPATASANQRKSHPYALAGMCAFITVTFILTGVSFTLLATGTLATNRPQYPDEITADKIFAALAFLCSVVPGGIAIRSAFNAATRYP